MGKLYLKIGEVCEQTGLKPSVLRFWETQFRALKPVKSGGGQRFYTHEHVALINTIKHLLYEERLTIQGAIKRIAAHDEPRQAETTDATMGEIRRELNEILDILSHPPRA